MGRTQGRHVFVQDESQDLFFGPFGLTLGSILGSFGALLPPFAPIVEVLGGCLKWSAILDKFVKGSGPLRGARHGPGGLHKGRVG